MLTEKGTQRIEIIVRKASSGADVGAKDKDVDSGATQDSQQPNEQDDKGGALGKAGHSKSWWRVQSTHILGVARQATRLGIQYAIAGIGYQHGDASLQAQIDRKYEIATDITSLAVSAGMGLTYGATGGPVGAIVGASLAVGQTAMSLVSKYATRQRDYDVSIFKHENAIEYKRARAQISLATGRLR